MLNFRSSQFFDNGTIATLMAPSTASDFNLIFTPLFSECMLKTTKTNTRIGCYELFSFAA